MTAAELIAELKRYPPGTLVVLSSDSEGNNYSPLEAIDTGLFVADMKSYVEEADEGGDDNTTPAVFLWPAH